MTIDTDVIIPITGRRKSGKDTLAKLAIEKYGAVGSVALSDWFKTMLSSYFKIPLAHFYGPEKDGPLPKLIVLRRSDVSRLLAITSTLKSKEVDARFQKISASKWDGLEITSIRQMMIWWANDVISVNFGDIIHNEITAKAIADIPRREGRTFNIILVTDARQFNQSNWFKSKFPNTYPIKIVRPDGTFDQTVPEMATEEFPEDYFYETIVNEGSILDLELKIGKVLGKIRSDLKSKMYPSKSADETETVKESE